MRNKSFTLLEMLIVVAIVVILAGALVPMFRITNYDAKKTKVLADLETIRIASHMLHIDTGQWPAGGASANDGTGLVTNDNGTGAGIPGWGGPYIDEWKDDPWGRPYEIWDPVVSHSYFGGRATLSNGPNRVCNGGTLDDIWLPITPDPSK